MIAQLVERTTVNRDVSGSIPDHYIGGGDRLVASTLAIIYLLTNRFTGREKRPPVNSIIRKKRSYDGF